MPVIVPMRPAWIVDLLTLRITSSSDSVPSGPRGLLDVAVKTFGQLTQPLDRGGFHRFRAAVSDLFFSTERKSAEWINRDFLHWFTHSRDPGRPFFVFLNYLDTHTPYLLPPGALHRFGVNPKSKKDYVDVLMDWSMLDKQRLPSATLSWLAMLMIVA